MAHVLVPVFLQPRAAAPRPPTPIAPPPVPAQGCMGGWCRLRGTCARYHASGIARQRAEERLCAPGERQLWQPIARARA